MILQCVDIRSRVESNDQAKTLLHKFCTNVYPQSERVYLKRQQGGLQRVDTLTLGQMKRGNM